LLTYHHPQLYEKTCLYFKIIALITYNERGISNCWIENNKITLETVKVEKGKAIGTAAFETIDADVLIIANRQSADTDFLKSIEGIQLNEDGTIIIDGQRMTGHSGIFAGGDTLPGENRSATIAIGHGKKAARTINSFLENQP